LKLIRLSAALALLLPLTVAAQTVPYNFSGSVPAAPTAAVNLSWQHDSSSPANLSAYLTLSQIAALFQSLTGCNTPTWLWSPEDGVCHAPSSGSITGVTGTAPIVSSGGAAPVISITQATTSTPGYLSSADWNTFNGKQAALTNPVTGPGSGATPGHVALMGNTQGTAITDSGAALPTTASWPNPGSCTNQFVISLANGSSPSCGSVNSNDVNNTVMVNGSNSTTTPGMVPVSTSAAGAYAPGDLWLREVIVTASCNGTMAAAGLSLPATSAPSPVCRTGTNVQTGYLQFVASQCAQFQDEIPGDWDTANGPEVRLNYAQSGSTASQSIVFTVQAAASTTTDDAAFTAAQTFSTTTTGGTANTPYSQSLQLNSTSITGWAAGDVANFKVCTASGSSATANLQSVTLTWPHKTPGVAEAN
jgi:hypothetical protein